MFSTLKGKFQIVQEGLSAGLRNLKLKDEKEELPPRSVNFDAAADIVQDKEILWGELRSVSDYNYRKAQDIDEQITKIRHEVFKRWGEVKEINQFVSLVPDFVSAVNNVARCLSTLQQLAVEIENALDNVEDLVSKQELERRKLEERFQFANYLNQRSAQTEDLKNQLENEYRQHVHEHEKKQEHVLKERQELCNLAFQQDLQLYKETGILPKPRSTLETELSLEDIQIEDDLEGLNELLDE